MNIREYYRFLITKSGELQEEMLDDQDAFSAFSNAHNTINDIESLIGAISERPESELMRLALRELQFSLLAASAANYRHAYISTRLFMELMIGAIYFSAYEIKLRNWLKNSQDIIWSTLSDKDNGPFSKNFISAFSPDFSSYGAQFLAISETVYRECSEYVHGNMSTHGKLDEPINFDKEQLIEWADRLCSIRTTVLFLFTARYSSFLSMTKLIALEPIILGELGDNAAIQSLYSK